MRLPLFFAWRYLFSRKSLNAVNIVSAISAVAVAVVSMALLLVLSIYNGYGELILSQTSPIDPDLLIERTDKRSFPFPPQLKSHIVDGKSVLQCTEMLQESCVIRSGSAQVVATAIGVENNFASTSEIENSIISGSFRLRQTGDSCMYYNLGMGVASSLNLGTESEPVVNIYFPKRVGLINPLAPASAILSGGGVVSSVFETGQEGYDFAVFVPIEQMRDLLQYDKTEVTSVALRLNSAADVAQAAKRIGHILGDEYQVKDRYAQYPEVARIVAMEKWVTFLILLFILLLALFNVVSSLAMLLIEKKRDIEVLRSLGMRHETIMQIFILEGMSVTLLGAISGLIVGAILAFLQQRYDFIRIGSGPLEQGYPVDLQAGDVLLSLVVIVLLSWICTYYAVRVFLKKSDKE
ncbi:MAG: FtsX-like permease family protein [Porphyromonas sp.]|nr:FtsX-like permease family protein [Porphyromonas sp.]